MKRTLIALTILVSGCAAIDPQPFTGPNGKAAYTMGCSGFGRTMAECYRVAGRLCPGGYVVVGQTNVAQQIDVDFAVVHRDLTVECK